MLVIRSMVLPATVEDATPLEGQGAHGGMMTLAAIPLLLIVSLGPGRLGDGATGELVQGLAEKPRTSPTPVDPAALAAALGDGSDARELLHLDRAGEALAVGAEGRQKARGQGRPGPRETIPQGVIGVGRKEFGDGLLHLGDSRE